MKKLIVLLITIALVLSMAVPVAAATPALQIPDVPQISKIDIKVNLDKQVYDNAVEKWFAENPIKFFHRIKLPAEDG